MWSLPMFRAKLADHQSVTVTYYQLPSLRDCYFVGTECMKIRIFAKAMAMIIIKNMCRSCSRTSCMVRYIPCIGEGAPGGWGWMVLYATLCDLDVNLYHH